MVPASAPNSRQSLRSQARATPCNRFAGDSTDPDTLDASLEISRPPSGSGRRAGLTHTAESTVLPVGGIHSGATAPDSHRISAPPTATSGTYHSGPGPVINKVYGRSAMRGNVFRLLNYLRAPWEPNRCRTRLIRLFSDCDHHSPSFERKRSHMRIGPVLATGAVLAATGLICPGVAAAHDWVVSSSPAENSTGPAPSQISITYNEAVTNTDVWVTGPDHATWSSGPLNGSGATYSIALRPSPPPGEYTVHWKNTAADGDDIHSSWLFTVG